MKQLTITILFTLLLAACSNTPKVLIIAPESNHAFNTIYSDKSVSLLVQDFRANRHIMQILKTDKAAEIINSKQAMKAVVKKAFTQIFTQQGLTVSLANNDNKANINLYIDSALINVQQSLVKYKASNEIVLRVAIQNKDKKLNKTFSMHGKSNGPFNADLAVLERDFNQQLTRLISQIVNDSEVQQFIKQ